MLQERMDSITQMISRCKHWSICKRQRWKEECFKKKMFQNYEKSTMDQLRKCKMKVLTWLSRSTNLNNTRKSPKGDSWEPKTLAGMAVNSLHKNQKTCCYKKSLPQTSFTEQVTQPYFYLRLLSSFVFIGQRSPFVNSLERMHFCIKSTTLYVRLYECKTRPRECFSSLSVFLP